MSLKMIPVRVCKDTAEKLKRIADREGRSQSDLVREMIEHFCDDVGVYDAHVRDIKIAAG